MSASLNKVQIIGNLGRDPEVRYTQDNKPIANLRVATTENWKDRNTGERQERTEWHTIVLFGPLAEVAEKYLKKGSSAYFEGKIQTRKWQDQSGNDRYSTEIVVDRGGVMQMLGGRSSGDFSDDYAQDDFGSSATAPAMKPAASADAAFDDDIPF